MNISPMLKHALESFEHGLEQYLEGSAKSRKFAFLHVDQAIELFLKEKAMRVGKSIYKNDGTTLSIHETFSSLKSEIKIPEKPILEDFHSLRNVIQHKGLSPDEEITKYHIENAYMFAKRFISDELGLKIEEAIPKKYIALIEGLELTSYEEVFQQIKSAEGVQDPTEKILSSYNALEKVVNIQTVEIGEKQKFRSTFRKLTENNGRNIKVANSKLDHIMKVRSQILHSDYEPTNDEAQEYFESTWTLLTLAGIDKSFVKK